jgi:hypothetical protein
VSDWKPCTKAEFDAFVAAYPRPLDRDVTGICEPPMVSYNDFTLGVWPESMVAAYHMGYRLKDAPSGYRIKP